MLYTTPDYSIIYYTIPNFMTVLNKLDVNHKLVIKHFGSTSQTGCQDMFLLKAWQSHGDQLRLEISELSRDLLRAKKVVDSNLAATTSLLVEAP